MITVCNSSCVPPKEWLPPHKRYNLDMTRAQQDGEPEEIGPSSLPRDTSNIVSSAAWDRSVWRTAGDRHDPTAPLTHFPPSLTSNSPSPLTSKTQKQTQSASAPTRTQTCRAIFNFKGRSSITIHKHANSLPQPLGTSALVSMWIAWQDTKTKETVPVYRVSLWGGKHGSIWQNCVSNPVVKSFWPSI